MNDYQKKVIFYLRIISLMAANIYVVLLFINSNVGK